MNPGTAADRSVSPLVGAVLMFGLVAAVALLIGLASSGLLGSAQHTATTDQATSSATAIAHDVERRGLARVGAPHAHSAADPTAGRMTVTVDGQTVVDTELGAVYYEVDDTTVAYQGGGVWRADDGTSRNVRPPPIQFADEGRPTLTLRVVTVEGSETTADPEELSTSDTSQVFPGADGTNPVENETVVITVQSQFYEAWGEYFENVVGGNVTYDHDAETTTVELDGADVEDPQLYDGPGLPTFFHHGGDDLDITNDVLLDSYDSSVAPYDPNDPGHDARVVSTGGGTFQLSKRATIKGSIDAVGDADFANDVDVYGPVVVNETGSYTQLSGGRYRSDFSTNGTLDTSNGVVFEEDLIVGGDLNYFDAVVHGDLYVYGDSGWAQSDAEIHGDVYVVGVDDLNDSPATIHGTYHDSPDPDAMRDPVHPDTNVDQPNVDVQSEIDARAPSAANDNANESDISGNTLDSCTSECNLTAGDYYLTHVSLGSGETLVLNATDGPIDLAVSGTFDVEDADIEVEYDETEQHPVRLYVGGDYTQLATTGSTSTVSIEGDRAAVLEVFMDPATAWEIDGNSTFRGIVYGMHNDSQQADLYLKGQGDAVVYGAMMGNVATMDKALEFHFDEDRRRGRFRGGGDPSLNYPLRDFSVADVGYLHVEHREVEVR